jgi:beta-glucosidase
VAPIAPSATRPPKELRVWAKATVPAGTTEQIALTFGPDAFHYWDTASGAWVVEPGEYDIVLAESAEIERFRIRISID